MDMIRDFVTELSEDPDIVDVPNDQDDVAIHEIPQSGLSEELIVLEAKKDQIEDIQGILSFVKNANGVSLEDVSLIESNSPGFKAGLEKDRVNVNQFTRQRSKVGYGVVQEHLNRNIRKMSLEFKLAFESLFEDISTKIERMIHEYSQHISVVQYMNLEAFEKASDPVCRSKSFASFVFTTFLRDDPFLNSVSETFQVIASKDWRAAALKDQDPEVGAGLCEQDLDKQSQTSILCQKAGEVYEYCQNRALLSFLEGVAQQQSLKDLSQNHMLTADSLSLKYMLTSLMDRNTLRGYLDGISVRLQELLKLSQSVQKEISELENNHEEREGYLLQNHSQISELVHEIDFIYEVFFMKSRLTGLLTEYTQQAIKVAHYR